MAANNMEIAVIHGCMNHLGFGEDICERMTEEFFPNWQSIVNTGLKDLHSTLQNYAKRANPADRIELSKIEQDRMDLMILWIQDVMQAGMTPDDGLFDDEGAENAFERYQVRKNKLETMEADAKRLNPGKYSNDRTIMTGLGLLTPCWIHSWELITGVCPYVTRKEEDPEDPDPEDFADYDEMAIECCELTGAKYKADSERVHRIIFGLVIGTGAEHWLPKNHGKKKDGRACYLAITGHYSSTGGPIADEVDADDIMDNCFYTSENRLTFKKFAERLQKAWHIYEDKDVGIIKTDKEKVKLLLKKCKSAQSLDNICTSIRRDNDRSNITFEEAVSQIISEINAKNTSSNTGSLRGRTASQVNSYGGGRGRGRGRSYVGRGGRGGRFGGGRGRGRGYGREPYGGRGGRG